MGLFLSFLIIISTFVYYVEQGINPKFQSVFDTLWWGIVTMTTVGYGDMVPVTAFGKLLGVVLILL